MADTEVNKCMLCSSFLFLIPCFFVFDKFGKISLCVFIFSIIYHTHYIYTERNPKKTIRYCDITMTSIATFVVSLQFLANPIYFSFIFLTYSLYYSSNKFNIDIFHSLSHATAVMCLLLAQSISYLH